MTKDEMIDLIKKALYYGISANKIEPERRGRTLGGLKTDPECLGKCSNGKIRSMYERARKALEAPNVTPNSLPQKTNSVTPKKKRSSKKAPNSSPQKTKRTSKKAPNMLPQKNSHSSKNNPKDVTPKVEIIERLERMESRFQVLEERLDALHALAASAPQKLPQTVTPNDETINGWRLRLLPKKTGGYTYQKWYAMKRLGGKTRKVYLGNNTDEAEAKIQAWLEKHPELQDEGGIR